MDELPCHPRSSAGRPRETWANCCLPETLCWVPASTYACSGTLHPTDRVFLVTCRALKATPASRGTREKLETPERT